MGDRLATIHMGRKVGEGVLCPFPWGAKPRSNTMWPGPRPTSVPIGILTHPAIWPQQTWAENWRGQLCPFWEKWVPIEHNVVWAKAYLHTKWYRDPSSYLATIDLGQNVGGLLCYFLVGKLVQHNVAWAEAYLPTKWHLDSSNCVATTHEGKTGQTDRQDRLTTIRQHTANRFTVTQKLLLWELSVCYMTHYYFNKTFQNADIVDFSRNFGTKSNILWNACINKSKINCMYIKNVQNA